jgi:heme oxygenase (mycobilin-producing)
VSYVVMNAVEVPAERREEFEHRFATRAGKIKDQSGFEAFELLKPADESTRYVVYTRWKSKDDFMAWMTSAMAELASSRASRAVSASRMTVSVNSAMSGAMAASPTPETRICEVSAALAGIAVKAAGTARATRRAKWAGRMVILRDCLTRTDR